MKRLLGITLLAFMSMAARAELRVVATVPNLGALARAVGGEHVEVRVLAPPDRDAHYLEARPTMMAALRRADLLVAVGGELEIGWLPAALQGSHNPGIQVGREGYFEGAQHVELIDVGGPADRAHGDVHPMGNPHFYLDPERMAQVGLALAERLGRLSPEHADEFRRNAEAAAVEVGARMTEWRERMRDAPGVLAYHADIDYLLKLFDVPSLGYIEPLPGIPPTARHLRSLVRELEGEEGVILYVDFHPGRGPDFLARELGWPAHRLPSQVPTDGAMEDFLDLIDRWVEAMSGAHDES